VSRRTFLAGLGGAAGVVLLAACGQAPPTPAPAKPTEAPKPAAAPTQAPAPAAPTATSAPAKPTEAPKLAEPTKPAAAEATKPAAAAAPKPGAGPNIINVASDSDPVSFDCHVQTNFSSAQGSEHFYESLTAFDDKLNIVPSIAASWEQAKDGLSYTFQIDPNAKWHDGSEVTAEDVKWTTDRLLSPEIKSSWAQNWYSQVKGAVVVDKKTVRVELKGPWPLGPGVYASLRGATIYPKDADKKFNIKTEAIGTGPYRLKEYVPADRIVYEKNPNYRNKDLPKNDGIFSKIMLDEDARIAAVRSGTVDFAQVSPEGAQKLAGVKGYQLMAGPRAWVANMGFPINIFPEFKDWRVRKAFSLATDREEMIKKSLFGAGVLSGFVPTSFSDWAVPADELKQILKRDVEQAKQLMADAGFPNGTGFPKVKMHTSSQPYPDFLSNAIVMQQNLKDIGVETEIVQMEWGAFVALGSKGETHLAFSAATFFPDPDLYLWPPAHSTTLNATRGYRHRNQEELDKLLVSLRTDASLAREQRRDLARRIDKMIMDDPPSLNFYNGAFVEAVSDRIVGYVQSFTGRRPSLKNVSLR
ncbi:MAG TPA: ABC transporter substrate-binding protein, partial [Chloroflexota bacterium]|nr:ABC transporter substrate-binding protein [Chloroflexota bacterium]